MQKTPTYYACRKNEILTIRPEASLEEAVEIMEEEGLFHLAVVDDQTLVGILAYETVVDKPQQMTTTVAAFMQKHFACLQENTDPEEGMRLMLECNLTALPVMRDGALLGFVSDFDLIQQIADNGKSGKKRDLMLNESGNIILANPIVQETMRILSDIGI